MIRAASVRKRLTAWSTKQSSLRRRMKRPGLRVEAKNQLEAQCYQLKSTMEEPNLQDKISEENRTKINELVTSTLEQCENPDLETDDYARLKSELEAVANPIIQELYSQDRAT